MRAKRVYENVSFERGNDPKESLNLGLRYKKDLKKGDQFLVWDKNTKEWDLMTAVTGVKKEFTTTYEHANILVFAHKKSGSWLLEASCIWNKEKERWEYLNQLRMSESIDFQRGKDPKKSMGIGMKEIIAREMADSPRGGEYTDDQRALVWACVYGKERYVQWLLENGEDFIFDPPKLREYRSDPVQIATTNGHLDIVEMLLDHGFKTTHRTFQSIIRNICFSDRNHYLEIAERILETHKFTYHKLQRILEHAVEKKVNMDNPVKKCPLISKLVILIEDYLYEASNELKESLNFERGKDPKKSIGIGLGAPYPNMTPETFKLWLEKEIFPYLDEYDIENIDDNLVRNDWEDDHELFSIMNNRSTSPDMIEELIKMREYFSDNKYLEEYFNLSREFLSQQKKNF